MKTFRIILLLIISLTASLYAFGQTCSPYGIVTSANGVVLEGDSLLPGSTYSGSAPIVISFKSNVDADDYSYTCEWRIYEDSEDSPIRVYYDEDFDYTFESYGSQHVKLYVTFTNRQTGATVDYTSEEMTIGVAQSSLKVPNAFSPNGDDINDVLNVTYQSLVKFDAYIFNRWGQQLYHWGLNNIESGWDGTYNGSPVKDGVYFILVDALGADGIKYKIKKDVNLLRGYTNNN